MKCNAKKEKGFTLIELMVVVAIIGILASIGVPEMVKFLKTSETAEATVMFGDIHEAVIGYEASNLMKTETHASELHEKELDPGGAAVGSQLEEIIPHLSLNDGSRWEYTITTAFSGTDLYYCIKADARADEALGTGFLLFSSEPVGEVTGWQGQVNIVNYIAATTPEAGGACAATGVAKVPGAE